MQKSQSTFKYNELSDSAKERARNHYIEHWIHENWYDHIIDDAKAEGKLGGFEIQHIYWSGFWSQGDGASWIGDVFLPEFIRAHVPDSIGRDAWLWLIEDGWVHDSLAVYQKGNYCHEMTMSVGNIEIYDHMLNEDESAVIAVPCILKGAPVETVWNLIASDPNCSIKSADDLEELALDIAREFAKDVYRRLEKGYEYECSEDCIAESFFANDVLFNEEGEQL